MRRFLLSVSTTVLALCTGFTGGPLAGPAVTPTPHASTHLLVCLERPLTRSTDGGFTKSSGRFEVDRLIDRAGVHRIDAALPITMAHSRNPEAISSAGLDRIYKFHVPAGSDIPELARQFAAMPGVEFAEPDYIGDGGATFPNDPWFTTQYGFHQTSDADTDGPEAWDQTTGSTSTIIAVLDTGIDSNHEDFVGKLVPGFDFANGDSDPEDDQGHGSNVSAIAAANSNNLVGVAGACWNCRIMPLKVLDQDNLGFYSWWADAMVWAADNGADVLNLSAGGGSPSSTLVAGVVYAWNAGVIHISITHNDNIGSIRYPGRYLQTITIGATNSADARAAPFCWGGGSNWGPEIDVVAPGDLIRGAAVGGGYNSWCGTSQAAPLVAGLVGLMLDVNPSLGREEARHLIRSAGDDQVGLATEDVAGPDLYHGYGRVNMDRTLRATRDSITMRAEDAMATRLYFDQPNPVASSYDFIRGDLSALTESATGVDLGTVVCLENDSPDPDSTGNEDTVEPTPGEGFFYLSRFRSQAFTGSYGGSTMRRDRLATVGNCSN